MRLCAVKHSNHHIISFLLSSCVDTVRQKKRLSVLWWCPWRTVACTRVSPQMLQALSPPPPTSPSQVRDQRLYQTFGNLCTIWCRRWNKSQWDSETRIHRNVHTNYFCVQYIFSASHDGNSEIWKSSFEFNYTEITELGRQGLFQTLKSMCFSCSSTTLQLFWSTDHHLCSSGAASQWPNGATREGASARLQPNTLAKSCCGESRCCRRSDCCRLWTIPTWLSFWTPMRWPTAMFLY